jgi:large-conductance mechanosensitive channel
VEARAARKQGAGVAWGNFLTLLINFVVIALALFLVAKPMNDFMQVEAAKARRSAGRSSCSRKFAIS